jgi:hypothetical protein
VWFCGPPASRAGIPALVPAWLVHGAAANGALLIYSQVTGAIQAADTVRRTLNRIVNVSLSPVLYQLRDFPASCSATMPILFVILYLFFATCYIADFVGWLLTSKHGIIICGLVQSRSSIIKNY